MIWAVGDKIGNGKYTISGAPVLEQFFVTYLAKDWKDQLVIIKTLNDDTIPHSDFNRWQNVLAREASNLARFQENPYIVKVQTAFTEKVQSSSTKKNILVQSSSTEKSILCIPMEYVSGKTLKEYVSKPEDKLNEKEAVRYILQIGEALKLVHEKEFYHLDIRPENIKLRGFDRSREAVLINFSLARDFGLDLTYTIHEADATEFTPPELCNRRGKPGSYSDIYSLGATLYFLITGDLSGLVAKRSSTGIGLNPPGASEKLKQAINWATTLEIENRPQSIQVWLDFLKGSKRGWGKGSGIDSQAKALKALRVNQQVDRSSLIIFFTSVIALTLWFLPVIATLIQTWADGCQLFPIICPTKPAENNTSK